MLYIPFLYFTCILIYVIKKYGICISACMIGSYALSSFFSIILYISNYNYFLVDFGKIEITIIPTVIYCLLLTFSIYPFIRMDSHSEISIQPIRNKKLFSLLTGIFFIAFILLIFLFGKQFVFNLMFGDLGELRTEALSSGQSVTDNLSGFSRIISTPVMIIGHVAYFAIPLFFYNLCFNPDKKIFNSILLLSSLSPVFLGVLNVDRSKTFYWVLLFIMCFFWFRKNLVEKSQRVFLKRIGFIVLGFLLLYFISVSISRFGERDSGTEGGFVIYAGQSFLNFVNLWDNYNNPDFTFARVFPFFNYFFGSNIQVGDWNDIAYMKSGMHINIFFTYLGMFLVDLGKLSVFVAVFVVNRIASCLVRRQNNRSITFLSDILILFAVAIIVQCGVISYFYSGIDRFIGLLFILLFCFIFKSNGD